MGLYNIRGKIRYDITQESLDLDKERLEHITVRETLQGIGAVYGHDFSFYNDKRLMSVYEGLSQLFRAREDGKTTNLRDITGLDPVVYEKADDAEDLFNKMTVNGIEPGKELMEHIRTYLTRVVDDEKESLSKENLDNEISTEVGTVKYELPNGDIGIKNIELPMGKDEANVTMAAMKTNIMEGKAQAKNLLYKTGGLFEKLQKLNDSKFFGNSSSFNKILEAADKYEKLMRETGEKTDLTPEQKRALQEVKVACDDYLDAKDKQHGFTATPESIENGETPNFKTESGKLRYLEVSELSNLIKGQLDIIPETDRDKRLAEEKASKDYGKTPVQTKDKTKEKNLEKDSL